MISTRKPLIEELTYVVPAIVLMVSTRLTMLSRLEIEGWKAASGKIQSARLAARQKFFRLSARDAAPPISPSCCRFDARAVELFWSVSSQLSQPTL